MNQYEKLKTTSHSSLIKKSRLKKKILFVFLIICSIIIGIMIIYLIFLVTNINTLSKTYYESQYKYTLLKQHIKMIDQQFDNQTLTKNSFERLIKEGNDKKNTKQDFLDELKLKSQELYNTLLNQKHSITSISNILTLPRPIEYIETMANGVFGKLCYSSSQHTLNGQIFHKNCEGISPTISIIKTQRGIIFGGVTYVTWDGNTYKHDDNAFLFSVSLKKKYPVRKGKIAISTHINQLPCFGVHDITINGLFNYNEKYLSCYDESRKAYELNDGFEMFSIKELEVFQLIPNKKYFI